MFCGHGQSRVASCLRPSRVRGLSVAVDMNRSFCADILHLHGERFADTKSFPGYGVTRALPKMLLPPLLSWVGIERNFW